MANIFIFEQGSVIKRKNNQITVYKGEEQKISFPLTAIENLYLFGKIEIKNSAITFLLKNNKYVVFLTTSGFLKGFLSNNGLTSNHNNRILQYRTYFDEKKKLEFCKKLVNQKFLEIEKYFDVHLEREKQKLSLANSFNEILGIEGLASTKMFSKFRKLLKNIGIHFKERNYNPPKDKVNAVLSTTYMFYYNLLIPITLKEGFDPYLGLMHIKRGTHLAFISDIMELSRPKLTYFVYELLSENRFKQEDFFKSKNKGIYLNNDYMRFLLKYLLTSKQVENLLKKDLKIILQLVKNT